YGDATAIALAADMPPGAWPDVESKALGEAIAALHAEGATIDPQGVVARCEAVSHVFEGAESCDPERDARMVRDAHRAFLDDEARKQIAHDIARGASREQVATAVNALFDDGVVDAFFLDLREWRTLAGKEVPLLTSGIPMGATTVVAGHGGAGKSTLVRALTLSVLTGRTILPCWPVHEAGTVVFLSGEDGENIFLRSLKAIAHTARDIAPSVLDEAVVERLRLRAGSPFRWLEDRAASKDYCEFRALCRKEKPALVVVDTVRRHFGADSENDSVDAGLWMQLATDIAVETGAAVVALHHASKGAEGQGSVRGSSAWVDEARAAFVLERTDPGFMLRHVKANRTARLADTDFELTDGAV
ncbi:MAG: AAA family ATPase, partial [bacterium]|nr:AAA family ATPase [bacterium]